MKSLKFAFLLVSFGFSLSRLFFHHSLGINWLCSSMFHLNSVVFVGLVRNLSSGSFWF